MKKILLILFIGISFTYGKDIDSTEVKLRQYKDMFENGLINETEYSKLKESVLFPNVNKDANTKPVVTDNYILEKKKEYIQNFAVGSSLIALGVGGIGGGIYFKNNKIPNALRFLNSNGTLNEKSFNSALNDYRKKKIIIFTTSSFIVGTGIVLEILGVHNRLVYINKKKDISISMSNEGIGMKFKFY
jgi:hypothetical protein